MTTMRTIARTIAESVLGQHAESTADRYVFVRSFDVSQREIAEELGRQAGGDWIVEVDETAELERAALAAREKGEVSSPPIKPLFI